MKYLNLGCGSNFHPSWTNVDFISTGEGVIAHNLREGIPFADNSFDVVYHSHLLEHFPKNEAEEFLNECCRVLRPHGIIRVVVPDLEQIAKLYLQSLENVLAGSQEWAANYEWMLLEMYDQIVRNHSGGEMATYLSQENIPNKEFVLQRLGIDGENLIKTLRSQRHSVTNLSQQDNILNNGNDLALEIGRFRQSGEIHQWMYDRYSLNNLLEKVGFVDIKICQADESSISNFSSYSLDVQSNGRVRKADSLFVEAIKPHLSLGAWEFDSSSSKNMKIVLVNTYDIQGGAARAAYRLHKGLLQIEQQSIMLVMNKSSVEPTVFAVNSIANNNSNCYLSEIQKHYIDSNRTSISNTPFSFPYPDVDLTQIKEIIQADIVNLHWVSFFQSPATINSLLSLGKPIIWTLHDMWAFTGGCHYSAGCNKYQHDCMNCPQLLNDSYNLPAAILKTKMDISANSNLTIVAPSQWLAECARKSRLFNHNRIEVIPNSIEINVFTSLSKDKAKIKLGINPDTMIILFAAKSAEERRKGLLELQQSLKICTQDFRFQELVMAGKVKILCFGYLNDELDSVGIPILSMGYVVGDEKISEFYSAADICVLPSLEDNLPNVMLESMSCGTPVVAFNIGGIPDVVKDGITGRIVPEKDVSQLAQVIIECVTNPKHCEIMGLNSRKVIEENYSLELQAQRYLELYQDLLGTQKQIFQKQDNAQLSSNLRKSDPLVDCSEKVKSTPVENILNISTKNISMNAALVIEKAALIATCQSLNSERLLSQDLHQRLHQTQSQLENAKFQLQQSQSQLENSQQEVYAMTTSKFWKLRIQWFKLKKIMFFLFQQSTYKSF